MRVLIWLAIALACMGGVFAYDVVTYHQLGDTQYTYTLVNESITVNITNSTVTDCNISYNGTYFNMTPDGDSSFLANISYETSGTYGFNYTCSPDGTVYPVSVTANPLHLIELNASRPVMETINVTYSLNATTIDYTRVLTPLSCDYDDFGFQSVIETTFGFVFHEDGLVDIGYNCTGGQVGNVTVNVTSYEPQLDSVSSFLDGWSAGSAGFSFGVYDFEPDGFDELIVLGNNLTIFENEVIIYENASFFRSTGADSYDYIILDADSDGDGDVILYNSSEVYFLEYDADTFAASSLFVGVNIEGVSPFDLNGDFFRDIIVLNGTSNSYGLEQLIGGSSGFTSGPSIPFEVSCDIPKIFDIDKNFVEDIVCLTTSSDNVTFYTRDSFGVDFVNYSTTNLSLDSDSDFFFHDSDSDGVWEIGIIEDEGASSNVSYFEINFGSENVLQQRNQIITGQTSVYSLAPGDIMNEQQEGFGVQHYSSPLSYAPTTVFYNGTSQNISLVENNKYYINNLLLVDLDRDDDLDIISGFTIATPNIDVFNNSIDIYRDLDLNYTYEAVALQPEDADNATFNVTLNASWQEAAYFMQVIFSDKTLRNDVFDSKLNMRYYAVNDSGNYTFNFANEDEYEVRISPVAFSSARAENFSLFKDNVNCIYQTLTGDWVVNSYCSRFGDGDNYTFDFTAYNHTINGARINWNNITVDGGYVMFNQTYENSITNVSFRSGTLNISGVGSIATKNYVDFDMDGSIAAGNTRINFTDSELNQLNTSNSSISLLNTNVSDVELVRSNITLNGSDILSGSIQDTLIDVYSGNLAVDNTSSIIRYYDCSVLNILNDGSFVSLNASYNTSFANISLSGNSFALCVQFAEETSSLLRSSAVFNFSTEFEYFPPDFTSDNLSAEVNISLEETGIPDWDYSLNGTFMTNFRDYDILGDIENITGVNLSRTGVNITVLTSQNLSDVDLEGRFTAGSSSVFLNFTGSINVSNYVANDTFRVIVNDTNYVSANATNFVVGSGSYDTVLNNSFSVSFPNEIIVNASFDPAIVYADYFNLSDASSSCVVAGNETVLDNGDGTYNVTDLGTVALNVTCSSAGLPTQFVSQDVTVSPYLVTVNATQYDNSSVIFEYAGFDYADCSTCFLNSTFLTPFEQNGSTCRTTFIPLLTLTPMNISCRAFDIALNVSAEAANRYFDEPVILGRVTSDNGNRRPYIVNGTIFVSYGQLNNSGNLFDAYIGIRSLGFDSSVSEMFYRSGPINESSLEITN